MPSCTIWGIPAELNFDSDAEVRYFFLGEVPTKFRHAEFAKSNERYAEFVRKADELRAEAGELAGFVGKMLQISREDLQENSSLV